MVRTSSVALTYAILGLLTAVASGTAAAASRTVLGYNSPPYDDEKLTGYKGVHHCGPNHNMQTSHWYSNNETTTTGRSATTIVTLQTVVGLKLCPDPADKCVFHCAPLTSGVHKQNETSEPAATQPAAIQQAAGRGGWSLAMAHVKKLTSQMCAYVQHSGPSALFSYSMHGLGMQAEAPAPTLMQRATARRDSDRGSLTPAMPREQWFRNLTRSNVQHCGPPHIYSCQLRGTCTPTNAACTTRYNCAEDDAQTRRFKRARVGQAQLSQTAGKPQACPNPNPRAAAGRLQCSGSATAEQPRYDRSAAVLRSQCSRTTQPYDGREGGQAQTMQQTLTDGNAVAVRLQGHRDAHACEKAPGGSTAPNLPSPHLADPLPPARTPPPSLLTLTRATLSPHAYCATPCLQPPGLTHSHSAATGLDGVGHSYCRDLGAGKCGKNGDMCSEAAGRDWLLPLSSSGL